MKREQHDTLYALMRRWGATHEQADDMLDGATFGAGLVGIQTEDPSFGPAIGIPVDEDVDVELGELLAWRAALDEDDYVEQWDTDPEPRWRIMLSPDSPAALARLTIKIRRPRELECRFLFDVKKLAPLLAELQRPGASVWLVPTAVVREQEARSVPGSLYDTITRSLLLGRVAAPLKSLDTALTHVGYTGARPAGPNRAQRRAQARKRKSR